jgi:hypothetical protein
VTPPPLPPHERAWRHPSELPAPRHEPPTRGGRLLIVATAAVALALVGVLAVRMTPGRSATRDALVTVTTSSVIGELTASSFGEVAGAATGTGRRFTDLFGRTFAALLASTSSSPVTTAVGALGLVVVTPFGSDGLGVTTAVAVAGQRGTIDAVLPSGAVVSAELIETRDGVAIVELADHADRGHRATEPTLTKPADDWTVVAFGAEIRVGEGDELSSLTVPEAAPIFDADGNLVGLCTIGPNGVEMLPLEALPDVGPPLVVSSELPAAATTETAGTTETTVVTDTTVVADTTNATGSIDTVAGASTQPAGTQPASTQPASTQPATTPVATTSASGSSSPLTSPPTTPVPGSSDVAATLATSEQVASSEPSTSPLT